MAFFGQKHGLTPWKKGDFMDFNFFLCQERFFFFLQSEKALFLGLFWSNFNKKKLSIFGLKHWLSPLKKRDLLDFEIFGFLRSRRDIFSSAKSDSIISRLINKNLALFGQKHGLTPLKKCEFLDYEKFCFLRSRKDVFSSAESESIISRLILIKFQ